jgi:hypothetical protein
LACSLLRNRSGLVLALALGAVAALGGCLFTDPINMRPTISIVTSMGAVWRGQTAAFTAVTSDADNDAVKVRWALVPGAACPDPTPATNWPAGDDGQGATFTVSAAETTAPFCLWAFATDRWGAQAPANLFVDPQNHPPLAQLDVEVPEAAGDYPLYQAFRLSAAASSDPENDELVRAWTFHHPALSTATKSTCPDDDLRFCFAADVDGVYEVSVKVSEKANPSSSTTATRSLVVRADQPPCLVAASPSLTTLPLVHALDAGNGKTPQDDVFKVERVDDDGDPFPAASDRPSLLHFAWSVGPSDQALAFVDDDSPTLTIAGGAHRVGDEVRVRVEISDRKTDRSRLEFLSCGDSAICPAANACFQRMTWTVSYR